MNHGPIPFRPYHHDDRNCNTMVQPQQEGFQITWPFWPEMTILAVNGRVRYILTVVLSADHSLSAI